MDNEELKKIFSYAGRKKGYDTVNASFAPHDDFKVTWTRSYRWADFQVSDYLDKAPMEVIKAVADTMFMRICGEGPKPGEPIYPEVMNMYLLSQEFRDLKTPVWVKRHNAKEIPGLQEHVEKLMAENDLMIEDLKVYGGT